MVPSPLVLASNSPRRRELLALTSLPFIVRPADLDETRRPGEPPLDYVLRLAEEKARAAAQPGEIVLASDTTVADGDEVLGKPESPEQAIVMLRQLRGRTHQVYTAVAVYDPASGALQVDACRSDVTMRNYSDEEIDAYVRTGDPMDKAGAYAIQNAEFHPVAHFAGCYASVVGLPVCLAARLLRPFGLHAGEDLPHACQDSLSVECPIDRALLNGRP